MPRSPSIPLRDVPAHRIRRGEVYHAFAVNFDAARRRLGSNSVDVDADALAALTKLAAGRNPSPDTSFWGREDVGLDEFTNEVAQLFVVIAVSPRKNALAVRLAEELRRRWGLESCHLQDERALGREYPLWGIERGRVVRYRE